jgi:hypothetical protein
MAALQATATLAGSGGLFARLPVSVQVTATLAGSGGFLARAAVPWQVMATLAGSSSLAAATLQTMQVTATLAGSSAFIVTPLPLVNVAAGDTIFYIFSYPDAGAASRDTTIAGLTQGEVLIYFIPISTVVPMAGYQVLVSQVAPVNNTLLAAPNLLFAYDITQSGLNQPSILAHPGLTRAQLATITMILSNFGTLVLSGVA